MLSTLLFSLFGFFCGSLPLAVWLLKFGQGKDVRQFGDGNPGATNALRAGGPGWGGAAYALEIGKAALPVGLATYIWQLHGWQLLPVALAPTLGHAYSPFLRGRGGKALATMLGAWIGLTLFSVPLVVIGALLLFFALLEPAGWVVALTSLTVLSYLTIWRPEPVLLAVSLVQLLFIVLKHRPDFEQLPRRKRHLPN